MLREGKVPSQKIDREMRFAFAPHLQERWLRSRLLRESHGTAWMDDCSIIGPI